MWDLDIVRYVKGDIGENWKKKNKVHLAVKLQEQDGDLTGHSTNTVKREIKVKEYAHLRRSILFSTELHPRELWPQLR